MTFVVIDKYGNSNIVEATDIEDAIHQSYDNHWNYDHIMSITMLPDDV